MLLQGESLQPGGKTEEAEDKKDNKKALDDNDISLDITKESKEFLLEKGTDLKYGARPLRRAIQRYIEDELSDKILRSELKNGQNVNVSLKDNNLYFEIKD